MRTRRHRHERLSPVVQRYFDAWVDRDTWDSWHPLDDEHFYRFVKAVARYSRRRPPRPGDIHALIVARWRGKRRADQLTERAEHFANFYETLLAYRKPRAARRRRARASVTWTSSLRSAFAAG